MGKNADNDACATGIERHEDGVNTIESIESGQSLCVHRAGRQQTDSGAIRRMWEFGRHGRRNERCDREKQGVEERGSVSTHVQTPNETRVENDG